MKQSYVLAFIFDNELENVMLIRKNRPDFQKGLLNGIGGKVESGETFIEAVAREVSEESGIVRNTEDFIPVGSVNEDAYHIEVFTLKVDDVYSYENLTDEIIEVHPVESLVHIQDQLVENVHGYITFSKSIL